MQLSADDISASHRRNLCFLVWRSTTVRMATQRS
jgi:hypothetical protein